jgi:hypothetical protein
MRWLIAIVLTCGGCNDKPMDANAPAKEVAAQESPSSEQAGSASGAKTAEDALTQTLAACKAHDETELWRLMATPFRGDISALASRMASVLSPAQFAEANAFDDPIETIDAKTFLRVVLRADKEHENPCWKVEAWKEIARDEGPSELAVLYELPNGHGRGVLTTKFGAGWRLSKITKSLKPEQYTTVVSGYQP